MVPELETFTVDSARLADGAWSPKADKILGEGDIVASYSADRICVDESIRRPFEWRAGLWVCVSTRTRNGTREAEAYPLNLAAAFTDATTYRAKTALQQGEYARNDPHGFYHGMTVRHGAQTMVLCGPPALFVPDEAQKAALQMDLFGGP